MKSYLLTKILALTCCLVAPLAAQSKPNIIFILTDDLGYGDLGVLNQNARATAGQPAFHTPRLDTMAAQGAILTRHYCPAPVCAPSRASLLLGVHQGHANVRNDQFDKVLEDNHTLGTVLRQAGYATAAIGKWGLQGGPEKAGDPNSSSFPTKRGFDFFFGYLDHSAGHRHYPKENPADGGDPDGGNTVWEMNSNVTSQLDKCYSTDLFAARAKKWITDHQTAAPTQPFFLYLSFTAPHAALQVPTQAYPAGGGSTGGLQWNGTPGTMINTASGTIDSWIHPDYSTQAGWSNANKRHATMVRRLDDTVGDLFQLLANLNIDNNTLVVFTSDNGPHKEGSYTNVVQDPQFFRSYAGMDGTKRDIWEAGIRMPTLVRWPGSIPAGRVSAHASQFHDWLPTFADLAGLPAPARSDGVSLRPALTGSGTQRDGLVYVEYSTSGSTATYTDFESAHRSASWNQQQAIHIGDYKGIRHNTTSHAVDFKIYNTATDAKETTNLAGQLGVPSQQEFKDAVLRVRRPNSTAARSYDNETVPSLPLVVSRPGVAWRAFEDTFLWVPDFTGRSPAASGETPAPNLAVRTRDNNIGIEFSGYLDVPATGDYTFYLNADTGAFLRLHRMQVLDADFTYTGGSEISSTVKLQAGLHPFKLGYRRGTAGMPSLGLSWSGPSLAKQVIPAAAFAVTAVTAPSNWPFEEGSGTTTSDAASGTASDPFGTGIAWSTATPGPASTACLSFPGTAAGNFGTNLDAADFGISGSGAKTITAWIRSTHSGSSQMFFGWSPTNGLTAGKDLRLGLDGSGLLRLEVNSGFARYDSTPLNDGQWHMVGLVAEPGDSTSTVQFYIDGALVSPTSSSSQLIDTAATGLAPRDELFLGIENSGGSQPWKGHLDDLRINAETLDEATLDARFTTMTAQPPPVEWLLDEGSGTTTSELTTSTLSDAFGSGIAWSTDTPGSIASISFGGSAGIGTNLDSVAAGINGSSAKTISAWIKTGTTTERAFFGYSPTGGGTAGADLRLLVNAAGQLRLEANSGNFALSSATVNNNAWHFVALVIPSGATTAGVSFYIDGVLTSPGSTGGTTTLNTASGSEIWIGTDGSTGRHFSGLIDHVRIHDRVLNLAELNSLRETEAIFSTWIGTFFPDESNPLVIGFDRDPDADGAANGLEYYLGGANNPSVSGPVAMPSASVSGENLVFTFTRRDKAEVQSLSARVEAGPDLTSWPQTYAIGSNNATSSPGVSIQENGTTDDTITVTIPLGGGDRRFARLVLTQAT